MLGDAGVVPAPLLLSQQQPKQLLREVDGEEAGGDGLAVGAEQQQLKQLAVPGGATGGAVDNTGAAHLVFTPISSSSSSESVEKEPAVTRSSQPESVRVELGVTRSSYYASLGPEWSLVPLRPKET